MSVHGSLKAFARVILVFVLVFGSTVRVCPAGGTGTSRQSVANIWIDPGKAEGEIVGNVFSLRNNCLEVSFFVNERGIFLERLVNRDKGIELKFPREVPLAIKGAAEDTEKTWLRLLPADEPQLSTVLPEPEALGVSRQLPGKRVTLAVVDENGQYHGHFSVELGDGSHYVRSILELDPAVVGEVPRDLLWLTLPGDKAEVVGEVHGSPVVVDDFFFFCEHPMAQGVPYWDGELVLQVPLFAPPEAGVSIRRGLAIGVLPPAQHRRGFLAYIERERLRPYSPFVNYNSWWDIAWSDRKMNEALCAAVIRAFGEELISRRKVEVDAFVFDDGWDDSRTLWQFHAGFPQGFSPLQNLAQQYGSAIGTWLSPFGGYQQARKERLKYGAKEGFETNERGFSLAGPKYYARFRDVCLQMLRNYEIRYFKFDGIAEGSQVPGASRRFGPDIEALLYLVAKLKEECPELFVSITTGTWPSPAWLLFGDSVWRGGHDWAAHGEGSVRQQWITYRDMEVYRRVVRRASFYPLNSLMTVTVCFGQLGTALNMGQEPEDVIDEMWMAAASGTQNFELYLSPSLMSDLTWDTLAETIRWIRDNREVLVDVHWVGGDPGQGEVYGYAAWSAEKAILSLRNPALEPQKFSFTVAEACEFPRLATPQLWKLMPRYNPKRVVLPDRLGGEEPFVVELPPLAILVLEATPIERAVE